MMDNRKVVAVMFGTDDGAEAVREAKADAISTGNQEAVAFLALNLSKVVSAAGVPRERVLEQLRREYRFDVAAAVEKLEILREGGGE